MKSILLTLIGFSIVNLSFAQVSRIVNSKMISGLWTSAQFSSNGIVDGDETHHYGLGYQSQASIDTAVIENIVYDKLGNVLEINTFSFPQFSSQNCKIIGVFKKSPDLHLIHIQPSVQSVSTSIYTYQAIIELNITTNTVVQTTVLNTGTIFRHTGNSMIIGNSIVSYAVVENVGLSRFAVSLADFTNITTELVDAQVATFGASNLYESVLDFCLAGNDEYISCSSSKKVYKRTGANQYTNSQSLIPPLTWPSIWTSSIAVVANTVVVVYGGKYCVLDNNLDTLSTGTYTSNGSKGAQIVSKDNKFIVLTHDNTYGSRLRSFDSNFQPLSSHQLGYGFIPSYLKSQNGKLSFFSKSAPIGQSGPLSVAVTLVCTNLSDVLPFQELGVILKTDRTEMRTTDVFQPVASLFPGFEGICQWGMYNTDSSACRPFIFAASNNLVAKSNNNVVGSYGTFVNNNLYNIGPMTNPIDYNPKLHSKYSRGNFVTKKMIEDHLDSLVIGSAAYIPNHGIREWPAHGDVSIGQAANLAPFVDVNSNGMYEPLLGDYPRIFGDECYLAIGHLPASVLNSSEIEMHSYRFTIDCDTSAIISKTIFQKNHFIPRGFALDSVYVGMSVDFDIGNPQDDYAGTNVELGLIYGYNGDPTDETSGGAIGFGSQTQAFGVLTLEGVKQMDDGTDNPIGVGQNQSINGQGYGDGVIDNERIGLVSSLMSTNGSGAGTGDPNTVFGMYNNAQGKNTDGSPQTIGSSGVPYNHAFFGSSDPLFYSSQGMNHGNNIFESNVPGDRRMRAFSGPTSAQINDTVSNLTAFLYGVDSVNLSPMNSVTNLFQEATLLRAYFAANNAGCGNTFGTIQEDLDIEENELDNIMIYPNPTQDKFVVAGLEGQTEIVLFDMNGSVLKTIQIHTSNVVMDLSEYTNGIYFLRLQSEGGIALKKVVKN